MIDIDDILCSCANMRPLPPVGYQLRRGKLEELDPPTHGKRRRRSDTLESLRLDVERILEGVIDDGWWYLDDDLIIACYRSPPEWIALMWRIAVDFENVIETTEGDVLMEEESSDEEEDT